MPETTTITPDENISTSKTKGRILIVDDEADIRESLEILLTREGYIVELATNANEGQQAIENGGHDVVLLDLMMPDRSGIDVLHEVRKRDTETPIILITAYGSVEVAVKAIKEG